MERPLTLELRRSVDLDFMSADASGPSPRHDQARAHSQSQGGVS